MPHYQLENSISPCLEQGVCTGVQGTPATSLKSTEALDLQLFLFHNCWSFLDMQTRKAHKLSINIMRKRQYFSNHILPILGITAEHGVPLDVIYFLVFP